MNVGIAEEPVMKMYRDYEYISDAVYGTIEIPRIILEEVIDKKDAQKLRFKNILPLNLVNYPSLKINALEHIFGVIYLATRYIESILDKNTVEGSINKIWDEVVTGTGLAIAKLLIEAFKNDKTPRYILSRILNIDAISEEGEKILSRNYFNRIT